MLADSDAPESSGARDESRAYLRGVYLVIGVYLLGFASGAMADSCRDDTRVSSPPRGGITSCETH
jgi:hypothetical protein